MTQRADSKFIFVWTGRDFPYVNLMSVFSVIRTHPNADLLVYVFGESPKTTWFEQLSKLTRVSIHYMTADELFQELPPHLRDVRNVFETLPATALSAKSNILRYTLLYLHGGVYLDFDVIVLRAMNDLPLNEAFLGEEMVWADDESRLNGRWWVHLAPRNILWALTHCLMWADSHFMSGGMRLAERLQPSFRLWSRYQLNNAVIGAPPKSPFIEELLLRAMSADPAIRYATGPTLVDNVLASNPNIASRRSSSDFYSVPPGQTYRLFYDKHLRLPSSAYLIHYAASNHAGFVSEFHPTQTIEFAEETVLGRILRDLSNEFEELQLVKSMVASHA